MDLACDEKKDVLYITHKKLPDDSKYKDEEELKSYYFNHLMSNFEKCLNFKVELKGKLDKKLTKRIKNQILETWNQLYENNNESDANKDSIFFMESTEKGHFVIISTFFHVQLKSDKNKSKFAYFKDLLFDSTEISITKVVKDIIAKHKDNINLYFKSIEKKIDENDYQNQISKIIIKHTKEIGCKLEEYCILCEFSKPPKIKIKLIHTKFESIQVYEDTICEIIYKFVEDYLTEAAKEFKFNKNLKINFKWTPDIHIDILNVLGQLEQKYKTKIRITSIHNDKNKGIDRFSKKVFKLLLNDEIKLYTNSDIDLPISVRTCIMNIKRQFIYSQLSKLEINDFSFDDGSKIFTLFIFLKCRSKDSKSIIGCTINEGKTEYKDFVLYDSIKINDFEIPNIFKICEQWQIKGKYTDKLNRKLNESECIEINSFLNKRKHKTKIFNFDEYEFHISKDYNNNLQSDKNDAYEILKYESKKSEKTLINIKINITKLSTKCLKYEGNKIVDKFKNAIKKIIDMNDSNNKGSSQYFKEFFYPYEWDLVFLEDTYEYACIGQERTQVENTILAGFKLNISDIYRIQNPALYYQYFCVRENLNPNLKVKSENCKENDEILECPALISCEKKKLLIEFEKNQSLFELVCMIKKSKVKLLTSKRCFCKNCINKDLEKNYHEQIKLKYSILADILIQNKIVIAVIPKYLVKIEKLKKQSKSSK